MKLSSRTTSLSATTQLACAVLAVSCLALTPGSASALPIFGGLTYNTATGVGYAYGTLADQPQRGVTNAGYAIGGARYQDPNAADVGVRTQYWTTNTSGTLPPLSIHPTQATDMYVEAVNSSNTVIGNYEPYDPMIRTLDGHRAFRYLGGVQTTLGNLGVTSQGKAFTYAHDLNDAGIAVGSSAKYVGDNSVGSRAVLWKASGNVANELQSLAPHASDGYVVSAAEYISNKGVIAGYSTVYSGDVSYGSRVVRWNTAGTITQLGILNTNAQGYTEGNAAGVNDAGVIIAMQNKYAANGASAYRPVRYLPNSTVPQELFGLGVNAAGKDVDTYAVAVGNSDLIVGRSERFFGNVSLGYRAVYWPTSGSTAAIELPNLGIKDGATVSYAEGVNASGVIAGTSQKFVQNVDQGFRAVLWTTTGDDKIIDLNDLLPGNSGWTLKEAQSLSDTGFVTGVGEYATVGNGATYYRDFSMLVPQAGTYGKGDANFDTKVNFDDLIVLAQHYNQINQGQNIHVGDFNLDGVVNFDDLIPLAQHYGLNDGGISTGFSAAFQQDWALAQSLVPEPTSLSLAALSILVMRRRR